MRLNNILIYFLVFFFVGCSDSKIQQEEDYIFGTIIGIKIYGETKIKAEKVSTEIFNEFHRLHKLLHPWEESLITKINHAISKNKSIVINNEEVILILQDIKKLETQTQTYFNPAIGKLIKLWGFHSNDFNQKIIPEKKEIKRLVLSNPSMNSISINNKILKSSNENVQIDLGGYAKGYALDQAKKILTKNNIKNALVNIGGNILAFGKNGERYWKVGIQHPRKPNIIATIDLLPGWAIGTSGDYQRYITVNNIRYSHLLDPKTGYPANNSQSATILVPPSENSGVRSDVFSKPLFISKTKDKMNIAKILNIKNFLIISNNNSIYISKSMSNKIMWEEDIDKKNITIFKTN